MNAVGGKVTSTPTIAMIASMEMGIPDAQELYGRTSATNCRVNIDLNFE